MKKTLLAALLKIFFVFAPIVFFVLFLCYILSLILIDHGLKRVIFVPIAISICVLLIIFKFIFKHDLYVLTEGDKDDSR